MMPLSLSILPHYFSVGNHRCFIVDFPLEYFIAEGSIPIIKPEMWRLTTSQSEAKKNYMVNAKTYIKYHKIQEKLERIE